MLAKIGAHEDLERKDWIFEPKLDGFRALCILKNNKLSFISRNNHDMTASYPEFQFRNQIKATNCVLDGEIVVYDKKGRTNFNLLQNRKISPVPATYVAFDILSKNGKDLTHLTLLERRKILQATIIDGNHLETIASSRNGKLLWKEIKKHDLEGVMAKDAASLYYPGVRTNKWLKIKRHSTIDCIIVGYTQEKRQVSSLALGLYDGNQLLFIGKVGTGFSEKTVKELYSLFKKIEISKPRVINPIEEVIWLKPKLVCEIKFAEVTKDKKLRSPVFLHLRDDKEPKECTTEQF